jgi:ABC-2 type transport system ATP-binding protein
MDENQNPACITVKDVSKTFKLPHERSNSIKSIVVNFYRRNRTFEKQSVLNDVSFEIKEGEFFGIVGRNGSGKSTLLKALAGIYAIDKGSIEVKGKLILTGRENVFLNGALLGFSRKEMNGMYQDIVDFAELSKFMDQKLKNYSSGMQVRLAFSIAIRAQGDILLLDEVLAVGDEAFQRKCYDYFAQLKKNKQTVILVTHDMGAVQKYCDRALMLESSKVVGIGRPREIALKYELANSDAYTPNGAKLNRPKDPAIHIKGIKLLGQSDSLLGRYKIGDDIEAEVTIEVNEPKEVQLNFYIVAESGTYIAGVNTTKELGKKYQPKKGTHKLVCKLSNTQLAKGSYYLNVGAYTMENIPRVIDVFDTMYGANTPRMVITERPANKDGLVYLNAQWKEK